MLVPGRLQRAGVLGFPVPGCISRAVQRDIEFATHAAFGILFGESDVNVSLYWRVQLGFADIDGGQLAGSPAGAV